MKTGTTKNGLQTDYHDNGQKKSEGNVKDGKKDGKWTEWDENGQINSVANYKDGKEDGKRILRNEKSITFHDENREAQIKEIAELILKKAEEDLPKVSLFDWDKVTGFAWWDGMPAVLVKTSESAKAFSKAKPGNSWREVNYNDVFSEARRVSESVFHSKLERFNEH